MPTWVAPGQVAAYATTCCPTYPMLVPVDIVAVVCVAVRKLVLTNTVEYTVGVIAAVYVAVAKRMNPLSMLAAQL